MTREDLLDQQIENYIHGRMPAEERTAFEESLKADEKLKNEIFELLALKSLYSKELFELKQKLDAAEKNLSQENFFEKGGET
jgi:anti-sigma factor RsiW